MPSKEVDRQLLLTYLEGNCTTDQLRQIKEYLTDEAYRDSLHNYMLEEWEWLSDADFPALPGIPEQYAKFRFFLARRDKGATNKSRVERRPVRRLYVVSAVAASVLLIITGTWLWRSFYKQEKPLAADELYYHNEPGHQTTVLLPDSSRVYLGAASKLRFRQEKDGNRLVWLEGQAYFEVKHDEHRPFSVRSGAITTVDIGTAFNIRYYPGDPSIEVAVSSGKVQVLHKGEDATKPLAVLDPGLQLKYDTITQRYGVTTLANTGIAGAWRKGVLLFSKQPLKEVTDELQRYYGVRFQYTNSAAENILITTVLDNKTMEDALDIVTLTAGIQFTRQGTLIVLK